MLRAARGATGLCALCAPPRARPRPMPMHASCAGRASTVVKDEAHAAEDENQELWQADWDDEEVRARDTEARRASARVLPCAPWCRKAGPGQRGAARRRSGPAPT